MRTEKSNVVVKGKAVVKGKWWMWPLLPFLLIWMYIEFKRGRML